MYALEYFVNLIGGLLTPGLFCGNCRDTKFTSTWSEKNKTYIANIKSLEKEQYLFFTPILLFQCPVHNFLRHAFIIKFIPTRIRSLGSMQVKLEANMLIKNSHQKPQKNATLSYFNDKVGEKGHTKKLKRLFIQWIPSKKQISLHALEMWIKDQKKSNNISNITRHDFNLASLNDEQTSFP